MLHVLVDMLDVILQKPKQPNTKIYLKVGKSDTDTPSLQKKYKFNDLMQNTTKQLYNMNSNSKAMFIEYVYAQI